MNTPQGPGFDRRRFFQVAGVTTAAAGAAALGGGTAAASPRHDGSTPTVANPGFEAGLAGWRIGGTAGAAHVDTVGHTGDGRLTHWATADYTATTEQTVRGLRPGWWTVRAWVKSGGALAVSRLEIVQDHRVAASTVLPNTELGDGWVQIGVSARVHGRSATIRLNTRAPGGSWATLDDVTIAPDRVERTFRGADLSAVPKNEDHGAVYRDRSGRRRAPEVILGAAGANMGRLKVWVNPADGYNDQAHVVRMGKRIKRAGMKLLVDFHYSDSWTDPGHQWPPAAWKDLDAAGLTAKVAEHTTSVLSALRRAGVTADYVQIGNEINPGMLWPLGQTWDVVPGDGVDDAQFDNLAAFLSAGARAAKAVNPRTKTLLHLTNVNNGIDSLTWWFDEITARDVPFDLIGLSFYGYWHGSFADIQNAITVLSDRYARDVLVVETAYPWTLEDNPDVPWENIIDLESELVAGYPATPASQTAYLRALQDVVAAAPGGRGLGTIWWEPAWTAVPGSGWDPTDPTSGNAWENQAVFDWNGRALPALSTFARDR